MSRSERWNTVNEIKRRFHETTDPVNGAGPVVYVENGVSFERRTAELADGLTVEGVFPEFDSKHHVDLGSAAKDMSLHQQFSACREDFQDHMYDCPEKLQDITFGTMERMDLPQGYMPEGYTWQHNPETGSFDLVSQDDHSVGHTGGNALRGN